MNTISTNYWIAPIKTSLLKNNKFKLILQIIAVEKSV